MKTVVVPTDFSDAADHALAYAVELAAAVDASVTLFHAYLLPVAMTDVPVPVMTADELKNGTEKALQGAKEKALLRHPTTRFETEGRLGDVVEEVEEFCQHNTVFAVVAGSRHADGAERFLFGSTAASLAKKCTHPVIVVPENTALQIPRNLALAVDFSSADEVPVTKINELTNTLQAKLQVVHVATDDQTPEPPATLLDNLQLAQEAYHCLHENDVTKGLHQFVAANNVDLLVLLPHKHTLLERLFFKGHTTGILSASAVPVMTVH